MKVGDLVRLRRPNPRYPCLWGRVGTIYGAYAYVHWHYRECGYRRLSGSPQGREIRIASLVPYDPPSDPS